MLFYGFHKTSTNSRARLQNGKRTWRILLKHYSRLRKSRKLTIVHFEFSPLSRIKRRLSMHEFVQRADVSVNTEKVPRKRSRFSENQLWRIYREYQESFVCVTKSRDFSPDDHNQPRSPTGRTGVEKTEEAITTPRYVNRSSSDSLATDSFCPETSERANFAPRPTLENPIARLPPGWITRWKISRAP